MLGSYIRAMVFRAEYAWQQYQKGRLDEHDLRSIARRIEQDFWGMAEVWEQLSPEVLDADFVAAVERELEQ